MRKTTIILPHYNRQFQLTQTLLSINKTNHSNFDVIIIDDASNSKVELPNVSYPISLIEISKEEKLFGNWIMPLPQMNRGMKQAANSGSEVIVLQNAECKHLGDVLMYAENNITNDNYISFGCYSLSRVSTFNPDIENNIHSIIQENNVCATDSEHDSWYNHPQLRGVGYDFCAAITTDNLIKLNGYDERYADGFCYGDDDFLMRIKRLGLKIDIVTDPIVLHQWHGESMGIRDDNLIIKNRELYIAISNNEKTFKAKHIYTEDL